MAASRYRHTNIISGSYYETFEFPNFDVLNIPTFNIRTSDNDRLDTLAFKHLGAGEYWWMIAMVNNLSWAFDFVPGDILKIPVDAQDILKTL